MAPWRRATCGAIGRSGGLAARPPVRSPRPGEPRRLRSPRFGCGVKFTQAFINREIPVQRYVGVDVNPDVIEFLRANVRDPRFDFHRFDVQNDLYNPEAPPLSADSPLPIDGQQFDVICLFSVFTHLAPHGYAAMPRLLRRFVKPTGRLFYTLFVNEVSEGGYGLIDDVVGRLMSNAEWLACTGEAAASYVVPEFVDMNPKDPLRWAVYSPAHALELVVNSGWRVEGISGRTVTCSTTSFVRPSE